MDEGLLSGIAEALKTGISTYTETADRNYRRKVEASKLAKEQEESAERLGLLKEQRDLEKIKLGIKKDQDGKWVQDPESLAIQKQKTDLENAKSEGLLKQAQIQKTRAEVPKIGNEAELKSATDLRKEFQARPETKRFSEVSTAFQKVQKAAEAPSAANDLSLIFGYMKMLDPGSTVREGEFANAQNSGGIPDKVVNMYNRAKSGERLNPEQRKQFIESASQSYQAELDARRGIEKEFQGLSGQYGVKPGLIYTPAQGLLNQQQDPQIADYAKQFGLSYSKAKSIIDKRRGQ